MKFQRIRCSEEFETGSKCAVRGGESRCPLARESTKRKVTYKEGERFLNLDFNHRYLRPKSMRKPGISCSGPDCTMATWILLNRFDLSLKQVEKLHLHRRIWERKKPWKKEFRLDRTSTLTPYCVPCVF